LDRIDAHRLTGKDRAAVDFTALRAPEPNARHVAEPRRMAAFEFNVAIAVLARGRQDNRLHKLFRVSTVARWNRRVRLFLCYFLRAVPVPKTTVLPAVWRRFKLSGFAIPPRLVGASHRFTVNGWPVEVVLPSRPRRGERHYGMRGNYKISCSEYRSNRPLSWDIHQLDVLVTLRRRVSIPTVALERVNTLQFPPRRRAQFEQMCVVPHEVAGEAFDRWLSTLRWKTLRGEIGQREIVDPHSGWGTYLQDSVTRRPFYATHGIITVSRSSAISSLAWHQTGAFLANGDEPPIWFDFLFEGQHRVASDDLHGGIACLAIACESVVRALMRRHLKVPINDEIAENVNRVSISRLLDKWKVLGYWTAPWQSATDLPRLKRLFELRNSVMHRGNMDFDKAECQAVAKAVQTFVIHGSPVAERLVLN